MNNAVKQDFNRSPVIVDELSVGNYQKAGTITAMLRQTVTVTSWYKGAQHEHDMQQNVFAQSDFADTELTPFVSDPENRVAFIDVPEGSTKEQVQALIKSDAVLYKILSHRPILHAGHKAAISSGITTLDEIADQQVTRYGAGHKDEGAIIINDNKVQYRKVFFWATAKKDINLKGDAAHPPYMSPDIQLEVNGGEEPATNQANVIITNQEVVK